MADSLSNNADDIRFVLQKLLPPSIFAEVPVDLKADGSLATAVRRIVDGHTKDLDNDLKAKLVLTETLIVRYHAPRSIFRSLLLDSACQTVPDAIGLFWESWHRNVSTRPFAVQLFNDESSAVIRALVSAGRFPIGYTLRRDVIAVLDKMVPSFDLLKQPLAPENPALAIPYGMEPGRKQAVLRFFASVQQLCLILIKPLDLPILMSLGFASAEQVAYAPFDVFAELASSHEISNEHARQIHNEAVSVQVRQEQAWMAMLRLRNSDSSAPLMVKGPKAGASTAPSQKPAGSSQSGISKWFTDMDEVSCLDCNSVTSPAAYFVDLLRMLKNLPIPATSTGSGLMPSTLLTKFFERRPDLGNLLLSCRNTTEVVPYIDLVNETLESTVTFLVGKTDIGERLNLTVYNADDILASGVTDRFPRTPANTQSVVYDNFISSQVYPSHVFPYDRSKDSLRKYLVASKSELAEVLTLFRADQRLAGLPALSRLLPDATALDSVHSRIHAAEILGMSELDFVGLTHESFLDRRSAMLSIGNNSLSQEDYEIAAGLLWPAEYWGYPGEEGVDDMLDTINGKGISFIKDQLLPRLAIDFATLTEILKTSFLGGRLAVSLLPAKVQLDPSKSVPSQLKDFRLCRIEAGRKLDEQTCHRLEQFVRLWRRLRWSISDVDDAISAFGDRADVTASSDTPAVSINANCIERMAAIVEIASLSQLEPQRILALFSPTAGYLLGLPITRALIASAGGNEKLLASPPASLSASIYGPLLLASLDMSYDDFLHMQSSEAFGDSITLQNLFFYNRTSEVARMFGSSCEQLPYLLSQLGQDQPALSSPKALIEVLRKWKLWQTDGWNVDNFLGLSEHSVAPEENKVESATLQFVLDILHAVASFRATSPSSPQNPVTPPEISQQAMETAIQSAVSGLSSDLIRYLMQAFRGQDDTFLGRLNKLIDGSWNFADASKTGFEGAIICSEPTKLGFEASVATGATVRLLLDQKSIDLVPKQTGPSYKISYSLDIEKDTATMLAWPKEAQNITLTVGDQNVVPQVIARGSLLDAQEILTNIKLNASLLERYPLSVQEISTLSRMSTNGTVLDLAFLAQKYVFIRKIFCAPKYTDKFARLFASLQDQTNTMTEDMPTQLAEGSGISKALVERILNANFLALSGVPLRREVGKITTMYKIAQQIDLLRRIGLNEDSVELVFKICEPAAFGAKSPAVPGGQTRPLTDLVQRVRSALTSRGLTTALGTTQDLLRDSCRKALVQYLIQHPALQAKGVFDADSLFEFLLIDVQMGCGLDTTRIKQAISTVQLFVNRCLLGLEKGVSGTLVNRERWQWMQKYTLWEANRKVFLYPENWAEPTLRESKTQLFRMIEEAVVQSNLDEKSINSVIRSYVCGADEIANLSVEAFFWDISSAGNLKSGGSFHFFARTRNAPFQYYYRKMDYVAQNALPATSWTAWEKLPFDIQANNSDDAGSSLPDPGVYIIPVVWRGRLMVFAPQLSIRASSGDVAANMSTDMTIQKTGGDIQKINLGSAQQRTKRNMEIKVIWSEFLNGSWTPQKQTQETLTVQGPNPSPPSFNSFRFAAEVTKENLSIFVYQSADSSLPISNSSCIGQFILQGPKLTLVQPPYLPKPVRFEGDKQPRTTFGHLKRSDKPDVMGLASVPSGGDANTWPDLSRPPIKKTRPLKSITWILDSSTRNARAAGLVADAAVSDGLGFEPWFSLPREPNTTVSSDQPDYENSVPFFNSLNEDLKAALTASDDVDSIYQVMDKLAINHPGNIGPESSYDYAFGCFKFSQQCVEDATPYSIYNWELGYHLIALLTERLIDLQQFETALKYARLVFDPTGNTDSASGPGQRPIWRFPPFRDPETRASGTLDALFDSLTASSGSETTMNPAVLAWRRNPFKPHAVAAGRPLAYMKRFAMKYVEALIAAGDVLFRQNSLESLPLAIQRYVEASHVFGPAPQKIPELGGKSYKTFNEIDASMDDFSNASVDLKLAFPYFVPLDQRGQTSGGPSGLQGFPKTRYFGVQANPEFIALRSLIDDRLLKIRNGLDINGNPRTLALWDPPIDVRDAVLASAAGSAGGLASVVSGFEQVMPRQRFQELLQKAFDLCNELKQSGAAFLAAIEKRDSEAFQSLSARQNTGLQRILFDMKVKQKEGAEKVLEQLQLSRQSAADRLLYYASLTGDDVKIPNSNGDFVSVGLNIPKPSTDDLRLTQYETLELRFSDKATRLNGLASIMEITSAALSLIPVPAVETEPLGVGMTTQLPSPSIATQTLAVTYRGQAAEALDAGQRASRIGGWVKQLQERRLELNSAGQEIKNIDKQIEAQKAQIEATQKDIASSQRTIDDAVAAEEFLRSKFTSEAMYAWYEGNARSYLYQIYLMAMDLARKVETAYRFELGPDTRPVLSRSGYWNQSRNGLLSGEQLWFALKRMETAYMNQSTHDFELVKDVSLRQLSSSALLSLRETGSATFDLPELMYDLDFPGHYCRRIKSVAFSVRCTAAPNTSINLTATLQKHRYRADPSPGSSYLEQGDSDKRFAGQQIQTPITSVALSHGQQDAGSFDLSFDTDSYQPFEGAGAIGTWRLDLPDKLRQFDYSSISDIVLQIKYTSKNGGVLLRDAANLGVSSILKQSAEMSARNSFSLLIDARNDSPDSWATMAAAGASKRALLLPDIRERLPYFTKSLKVAMVDLKIYTRAATSDTLVVKASSVREGTDGVSLNAADMLGGLQQFISPPDASGTTTAKKLDQICSSGKTWYIVFTKNDGGVPDSPRDVLILANYRLIA